MPTFCRLFLVFFFLLPTHPDFFWSMCLVTRSLSRVWRQVKCDEKSHLLCASFVTHYGRISWYTTRVYLVSKGVFGRVYSTDTGYFWWSYDAERTEVSGTGTEFVPNHAGVFNRVLRLHRTLPKTFAGEIPPVYFGTYPAEDMLVKIALRNPVVCV